MFSFFLILYRTAFIESLLTFLIEAISFMDRFKRKKEQISRSVLVRLGYVVNIFLLKP